MLNSSHKAVQHSNNNLEIVDFPRRKEYIMEIIESPDARYLIRIKYCYFYIF